MTSARDLVDIAPARCLDLRGETCPTTSDETLRAVEVLAQGEVLELISDYYPARSTIPYHCEKRGYPYLLYDEPLDSSGSATNAQGVWRMRIQKT
jgi:TusA-related sulfurtransferase